MSEQRRESAEAEAGPDPAPGPSADGHGLDAPGDPEPIPRLPRGKGVSISGLAVTRILMVAGLLIAVLVLRKPCSDGVAGLIGRFEPDASPTGQPDPEFVPGTLITGDMSEEERQKLIEQELRRARQHDGETGGPGDAGPR